MARYQALTPLRSPDASMTYAFTVDSASEARTLVRGFLLCGVPSAYREFVTANGVHAHIYTQD